MRARRLFGPALALALLPSAGFGASKPDVPNAVNAAGQLYGPDAHGAAQEFGGYFQFIRRSSAAAEEVELGRQLFFDTRLSRNRKMGCATCHKPELAWTDGLARARGKDGQELRRNTMSLLTARYGRLFFWDGRASDLEQASLLAIQNPDEMNEDLESLVSHVNAIPGYRRQFSRIYGGEGADAAGVGKALAAFMLSIPAAEDSDFDRFLNTGKGLSPAALRGWVVFSGPGNCRTCHFPNSQFHDIGLRAAVTPDLGRYMVEPTQDNWRAFKTPSLRNVARTPPYMHDGSLATLRDVIEFYNRGGDEKRYKDENLLPLHLTEGQKADLEAFLRSLNSTVGQVAAPKLPPDE